MWHPNSSLRVWAQDLPSQPEGGAPGKNEEALIAVDLM
jgi:hypothetical protein